MPCTTSPNNIRPYPHTEKLANRHFLTEDTICMGRGFYRIGRTENIRTLADAKTPAFFKNFFGGIIEQKARVVHCCLVSTNVMISSGIR